MDARNVMGVYTINDELAKESSSLFEQRSDELALRQFRLTIAEFPKQVAQDMRLYKIGEYSHTDMSFSAYPLPVIVDESTILNDKDK